MTPSLQWIGEGDYALLMGGYNSGGLTSAYLISANGAGPVEVLPDPPIAGYMQVTGLFYSESMSVN